MAKELRIEFSASAGVYLQSRVYELNSNPGYPYTYPGFPYAYPGYPYTWPKEKLLASDYEYAVDGVDTPFGLGGSLDFLNIRGIGGAAQASAFGIGVSGPVQGFGYGLGAGPGSPVDGKERLSFALDHEQIASVSSSPGGRASIAEATFSLTGAATFGFMGPWYGGKVVAYLYHNGQKVGEQVYSISAWGQITVQADGRVFDEIQLGSYGGKLPFYVNGASFKTSITNMPAAPVITELTGPTNDTSPTLSGKASPNSTVTIRDADGNEVGTTVADADGKWTFPILDELPEGIYRFTATATDAAGNVSGPSAPVTVTIDTTRPDNPTVDKSDAPTNNPSPEITGTAEPGSTVTVYKSANVVGTAVTGPDGKWTVILDGLGEGNHNLSVRATDAAGNESFPTKARVEVDTTAPQPPTIAALSGPTSDNTPALSGTAEPGSTVTIRNENGNVVGTAVAGSDGKWTATLDQLGEGEQTFTATATDAAGNVSDPSDPVSVTVDTTGPQPPAIDALDGPTSDTSPTLTGTAEPGNTVTIRDENGNEVGTAVAGSDGKWTVTLDQLDEGEHTFTATATDDADNVSDPSAPVTVTVDTTAPQPPTIDALDGPTNETSPALTGTAEPGSTVTIRDENGNEVGTAVAGSDGKWTATLDQLDDGEQTFTATATDAAGNVSDPSDPVSVTVDTTGPQPPAIDALDGPTSDTSPTLTGTAEPGSTVTIRDENGNEVGTAVAGSDGKWTATLDELDEGEHIFTATATDAAGNVSDPSDPVSVTIDATGPDAPTIDALDGPTSDTSPTLTGTAEPGSTVTILDENDDEVGTAVAGSDGKWTATLDQLTDGEHIFTATATDAAGNVSGPSDPVSVTIETPNAVPTITSDDTASFAENDTGVVYETEASDSDGDDLTYSLSGVDKDLFTIDQDGKIIFKASPNYEAPQDAGGDNVYNVTVEVSDGKGKTTKDVAISVTDVNEAPQFLAEGALTIERISTNSAGEQGIGGDSLTPVFSPDGTKVAFASKATNLVEGDSNGIQDIFVKNLVTGEVKLVSAAANGAAGNGASSTPVFSPDGNKIAFTSSANNLDGSVATFDIFVKDLTTDVVTRLGDGTGPILNPVFSPDGTSVAFMSFSPSSGLTQVLVKNLETAAVTLVSSDIADGTVPGNKNSYFPVFSPDGTRIAFSSMATNLVDGGTNGNQHIFVKDLTTGAVSLVSIVDGGPQGNGSSDTPVFSPDGNRIAFASTASNLLGENGDTNSRRDIFVKDLATGALTLVSIAADGVQSDSDSTSPVFSPDGTKVAFVSKATSLVDGGTNGRQHIFVKDLTTGALMLASSDIVGGTTQGDGESSTPVFSPDGTRVVFASRATNLAGNNGDTNGAQDIFVKTIDATSVFAVTVHDSPSRATLSKTATVYFDDEDAGDSHNVTAVPHGETWGTVNTRIVVLDGVPDQVVWTYEVDRELVKSLAKNETREETFTLTLTDSEGETAVRDIVVTLVGINDTPVITSGATASVAENATGVVYETEATDVDGDDLTYTLSGDDADLFNIDQDGKVTFKAAPDYEDPKDADGDNVYNVTIEVSDGTAIARQDVAISVTDLDETPPEPAIISVTVAHARKLLDSNGAETGKAEITFTVTRTGNTSGAISVPFGKGVPEGGPINVNPGAAVIFEDGETERTITFTRPLPTDTRSGIAVTLLPSTNGSYILKEYENSITAYTSQDWKNEILIENENPASLSYATISGNLSGDAINIAMTRTDGTPSQQASVSEYNVYGGDGNDKINISSLSGSTNRSHNVSSVGIVNNNYIYGGQGDDAIKLSATGGGLVKSQKGQARADATISDNYVYGSAGNDIIKIFATGGNSEGDGTSAATASIFDNFIYGGTGDDTIKFFAKGGTINGDIGAGRTAVYNNTAIGGDGADTFSFIGRSLDVANESNANVILDFNADEGDRIALAVAGNADNFVRDEGSYNNYGAMLIAANGVLGANDKAYYFVKGGDNNGYLFYDLDGIAGADQVIKLSGVTAFDYTSIITDQDEIPLNLAMVSIELTHMEMTEDGKDQFTFTVSRKGPTDQPLTVRFTTGIPDGGQVTVFPSNNSLSFEGGQEKQTITVIADAIFPTPVMEYKIALTNPSSEDVYKLDERHSEASVKTTLSRIQLDATNPDLKIPGTSKVSGETIYGHDDPNNIEISVIGSSGVSAFVGVDNNNINTNSGEDKVIISAKGGTTYNQNSDLHADVYENNVRTGDGNDAITISALGGTANNPSSNISANIYGNTVYAGREDDIVNISATGGRGTSQGMVAVAASFEASASIRDNIIYGNEGNDSVNINSIGGYATISTQSNGASEVNSGSKINSNIVYGGNGGDAIIISATGGTATNYRYSGGSHANAYTKVEISYNTAYGDDGDDTIIISSNGGTANAHVNNIGDANANANANAVSEYNTVYGGDGNDTITVSAQGGTANSGGRASSSNVFADAEATTAHNDIYGGDGNDTIMVTATGGTANPMGEVPNFYVNVNSWTYSNTVFGDGGADAFSFIGRSPDVGNDANANVIGDFDADEGDRIVFSVAGSDTNFSAEGTFGSYSQALNAASAVVGADTKYYFASVGNDGFLFYDLDGDAGADHVIKLTGVTAFEFTSIVKFNVGPVFDAPSVAVTFAENETGPVHQAVATDEDNDDLTYTLSGVDKDLFAIDGNGTITFKAAPDYEDPKDAGGDNVYDITVEVSDGTAIARQDVTITVTDVDETPPEPAILSVWAAHLQPNYGNPGREAEFTFTVTRSGNNRGTIIVPFEVTAPEASDAVITPSPQFLTFNDNDTEKTITVIGYPAGSSEIMVTLTEAPNNAYDIDEHEGSAVARLVPSSWSVIESTPFIWSNATKDLTFMGVSIDNTMGISALPAGSSASSSIQNVLYGGTGNDTIIVSSESSSIAHSDSNSVYGGYGNDTVTISSTASQSSFSSSNYAHGGEGDDTVIISATSSAFNSLAQADSNTVYGGIGDDAITITATGVKVGTYTNAAKAKVDNNTVYGGAGNDTVEITAKGADNNGTGAAAKADVSASANGNNIYGGIGNDTIKISATGGTMSVGNSAQADASAAAEDNTVYGGAGDDIIEITAKGGHAIATYAGQVNAIATAQATGNVVYGGEGNDRINITSTSGSVVNPSGGNTTAQTFGNVVYGGEGSDTFSFIGRSPDIATASNANVIGDFNAAEGDKIALTVDGNSGFQAGGPFANYSAALAAANGIVGADTKYYFASVENDGFLFYDLNGTAGADHAIKLTGVTTLGFESIIAAS